MTKGVLVVTWIGIVVDVVSITAAAVSITDVDSMTGVVSRTGVGVTVAAVIVSAIGIDAVVVALVSVLVVNPNGSVVSGTLLLVLTNTVVSSIVVVVTVLVIVLESLCNIDTNAFIGRVTPLPPNERLGFKNFCSLFSNWSCNSFNISRCFIAALSSVSWSILDG